MFYVFFCKLMFLTSMYQTLLKISWILSFLFLMFFLFSAFHRHENFCLKFYFYFSISITFYDSLKMWDLILVKEHNDGRWHKQ